MARISGIDLPNKKIKIALTYIYGIGKSTAMAILSALGINTETRANDLTEEEINSIRKLIEKDYIIEGEKKTQYNATIKRLIDINCYRGIRHRKGLPVRGQRSKTNARTRKGKKR